MATHRVEFTGTLTPGGDDVAHFPQSVLGTNDTFPALYLHYGDIGDATAPTTALEAHGHFDVPENYASGAVFRIRWATTKTTGDVVWDVAYRAVGGDDTESLDQATAQETVSVTDTAGSAAWERLNTTVSATDGNFAAGDTVTVTVRRDGADASDTLAGVAILFQIFFEYSD